MNLPQLIDQYAAYDLWANTRLVERLSRENEAVLDTYVKSSFPSLRSTLMHIRDAECAWRARLSGETARWPAEESIALDTLLKQAAAMRDLVRSFSEKDLLTEVVYRDLKGNEHTQVRIEALMHCFNHGSYHRGQVVTIMRQLDLPEIPGLDLVTYQRLAKQGKA